MEFNDRTMQLVRYAIIFGGPVLGNYLGKQYDSAAVITFADWVVMGLPYAASGIAALWGFIVKRGTVAVPTDVVRKSEENPSIPTIPTVSGATGQISVAPEVPRDVMPLRGGPI